MKVTDLELVELALRRASAGNFLPDVKDAFRRAADDLFVMMRERQSIQEAEAKKKDGKEDKAA